MSTTTKFSIQIVDSDGDPVSGYEVYVSSSSLGGAQTQYTDDDGLAEFEFICYSFYGYVHIAGEEYEINADDGDIFPFTV